MEAITLVKIPLVRHETRRFLITLAAIVYAAPMVDQTKTLAVDKDLPLDALPLTELESSFKHDHSEVKGLHVRQYTSDTYNGITDGKKCRPVTIIYARGSTQAGNVGKPHQVGGIMFNRLAWRIGASNLTVQGVPYGASYFGYLIGGCPSGSLRMQKLIEQAAKKCPKTKIVLSGYSQGAQLVYNAVRRLPDAPTKRIFAVVVFGDRKQGAKCGKVPKSRILVVCRRNDFFCARRPSSIKTHRQYEREVYRAVDWIVHQLNI
ncbi:cutinase [Fusarium beomiforme]|uniref:Cutinase n=1 Tax=Fusarium beomiforme TaxID=44412 RepID=A0A9P5AS92_9HYPO|nr:cutinase [Fusarium beomiforme]